MRFPESVRMADGADGGPVWARSKRRAAGGNPIIGTLVTLLALFGALTAVLAIKERSAAEGGAIVDRWIAVGWNSVRDLAGQGATDAGRAAEKAADEAGQAATRTGDALKAGADKAAEDLKRP